MQGRRSRESACVCSMAVWILSCVQMECSRLDLVPENKQRIEVSTKGVSADIETVMGSLSVQLAMLCWTTTP